MTLRIGILGAADIAPRALIAPAAGVDDVEIAAVAARGIGRARAFAAEHGIPAAHGSYEELLTDPDIEAVYVPSPNGLHGVWTTAALRAGKHVLCEKPFAANAAEAEEVAAVAQSTGLVVMEAFHNLYHPITARMIEIVDSGELGTIGSIESLFGFSIEADEANVRWQRELAGGSLMDVGCYPIRLLRALVREEPVVTGAAAHTFTPDVDGDMTVDLEFPSGVTGQATGSMWMDPPASTQHVTIVGDRGTLTVTNPFLPQLGNELTIRTADGTRTENATTLSTYRFQLEAFRDAVVLGSPVLTDPADSIATMRVIDAAYKRSGLGVRQPTRID
ncbi:Gfo/Idh/MocA family oxidoreductase [Okibacterium endophyticum]